MLSLSNKGDLLMDFCSYGLHANIILSTWLSASPPSPTLQETTKKGSKKHIFKNSIWISYISIKTLAFLKHHLGMKLKGKFTLISRMHTVYDYIACSISQIIKSMSHEWCIWIMPSTSLSNHRSHHKIKIYAM